MYQAAAGIEHNWIVSNTASGDPAGYPLPQGGGIYLNDVTAATVSDNEIRGNALDGNAGGGGGIGVVGGSGLQIRRNTVVGNRADTWSYSGSGIEINGHSSTPPAVIDGNWLSANDCMYGGAVLVEFSSYISLTNNVVANNRDSGVYLISPGTGVASINNTVARNSGNGIDLTDGYLDLYNTIVASNTGYGIYAQGSWSLLQTRNDVWGNGDGGSNVSLSFYLEQDPLFFDASADLYALRHGSPCIDDGDSTNGSPDSYNGLPRPQGGGYDLGAYEMPPPTFLPLVLRNF